MAQQPAVARVPVIVVDLLQSLDDNAVRGNQLGEGAFLVEDFADVPEVLASRHDQVGVTDRIKESLFDALQHLRHRDEDAVDQLTTALAVCVVRIELRAAVQRADLIGAGGCGSLQELLLAMMSDIPVVKVESSLTAEQVEIVGPI